MNTYDGPHPEGVPNPFTPMLHSYPTRYHGPVYTRPMYSLPWADRPNDFAIDAAMMGLGGPFDPNEVGVPTLITRPVDAERWCTGYWNKKAEESKGTAHEISFEMMRQGIADCTETIIHERNTRRAIAAAAVAGVGVLAWLLLRKKSSSYTPNAARKPSAAARRRRKRAR